MIEGLSNDTIRLALSAGGDTSGTPAFSPGQVVRGVVVGMTDRGAA